MINDNSILKGKWIITYNNSEFEYREVMGILIDIHERLDKNQRGAAFKLVVFDKNFKNGFHFKCLDIAFFWPLPHDVLCFRFYENL